MNIAIIGGRVIDPAGGTDEVVDLYIAEGHIVGRGRAPDGLTVDRRIAAHGLIVCPGLMDLRVRLREPGEEHKATLDSETRAALAGGITTVCCPPDTIPPIDTLSTAQWLIDRSRALGRCHILPIAALTRALAGTELADMQSLMQTGCIAVSNAGRPIRDTAVLRYAFEYAAGLGIPVFLEPEDPWLAAHGVVHEGEMATRLGLAGIPTTAETVAVARDLLLIEQTGVRAHLCGLSAQRSVELVAAARHAGLAVTADTAIHQLHLTDADIALFNTHCHVRPPLRSPTDRDALRAALADGTLDAVCSDHQPHEADAKQVPFRNSEPGMSGLETLLPLTLALVADGVLTLSQALHRLTAGPAAVLGRPAPTLTPGAAADLCVFDAAVEWTPGPTTLTTQGLNSPFIGRPLRGCAVLTMVDGRVGYAHPDLGQQR